MAADFNLTNQYISQSFEQLMQISGSIPVNGTGSAISNLSVTASQAISASYVDGNVTSASYATNADTASFFGDGIVTASAVASTITFTKDNGTTFDVTVAQSGSVESASYAATATSASHALFADLAADANDLIVGVKNTLGVTISKGQTLHATGVTGQNIDVITASCDGDMPALGLALTDINASATGNAIISGKIIGIDTSTFVAGNNVYVGRAGAITATKPTGSSFIQNIGIVGKVDATDGELVVLGSGRTNDLPNLTTDYIWKGDANGVPQAVASSSIIPTTANTASYVAGANVDGTVASATSASFATNSNTTISASHAVQADSALTANSATTATSASHAVQADSAISSSHAVIADSALSSNTSTSASHAVNADTASFLPSSTRLNITDITASNASFTSASIGYLKTITGSATIIGDEYIILNADSPTKRFAGIKVYDSGSGLTGSFEWDSVDDNWIQVETGGESAGMLTGPSGSKGSEVYPTANTLIKGTGNHTVVDTNITDDGSTVKINSNSQITGSLNVSAGITGSLLGTATTASYVENSQTASYVFNSGIALVSGSSATLKNALPGNNASSTMRSVSNLPITNAYGKTFDTYYNEFENYPAGDQQYAMGMIQGFSNTSPFYENVIFTNTDRVTIQNSTSGSLSGLKGQLEVRDLYDQTNRTLVQGDLVKVNGGSVQITGSSTFSDTATFNGATAAQYNGTTVYDGAIQQDASLAQNYFEGKVGFRNDINVTGSLIVSGGNFDVLGATRNGSSIDSNFKQNLAPPGTNNQYDLIAVSPTTIDNLSYTNINNFFASYPSFGSRYKDYFATEYYDSFSYNYGSEFSVNGLSGNISTLAGNGQFGQFKTEKKKPSLIASGRGTVSGSHTIMQAGGSGSQALIYGYNGASVVLEAVGSQGGEAAYMSLFSTSSITLQTQADSISLKSGTATGGFYLNVTGSVTQPTASVNINSNTGSLENYKSNFHSLTLVSGSDTHLKMQTTYAGRPGQTISLEVKQPTTATDSYGTLSFAPEFKFAGGTAPTITAASGALDVLTFQTYDGSTYYGTAIQNFS